jgi:hypothetical protein
VKEAFCYSLVPTMILLSKSGTMRVMNIIIFGGVLYGLKAQSVYERV